MEMAFLPAGRTVRAAIVAAIIIALGIAALVTGRQPLGIALLVVAAVLIVAFAVFVVRPARIPRGGVLTLRLHGVLREHAAQSPLMAMFTSPAVTLFEIRRALEAAARDRRLRAVIVEIAALQIGLAAAQELHEMLRAIKDKRSIALLTGDQVTVAEYFAACGASQVVINPDTMMSMTGAAAGGFFLKGALAKVKVDAQVLQFKEYKGAAETFARERMSPALRESLQAVVDDWRAILSESVGTARGMTAVEAGETLSSGFLSARQACERRLADKIGYGEEVRGEFDPKGHGRVFVGIRRYLRRVASLSRSGAPRIAVVHGVGPVVAGEAPSYGDFISGETTGAEIARAARDKSVRAIVFRVNSPGGSAVGSDLVWRAIREAQERGKPVVVSMGDVAGSGGYYVAMGADAIVAEPATITGSIGVVYMKLSVPRLLADLGVNLDFTLSDPIADAMSISRTLNEAELRQLTATVGELYAGFTAKVAAGRKLDAERAEELARGRIWSGRAARAGGLVDALGGMGEALSIARAKAGLAPDQPCVLVPYPGPGLFASLQGAIAPRGAAMSIVAHALGLPERWVPGMLALLVRGGAALLCPFF